MATDKLLDGLAPATAVLQVNGAEQRVPLTARRFSSGKAGYFWQGKVSDGTETYQAQVTLTIPHSESR